jgi:hypothetical protein
MKPATNYTIRIRGCLNEDWSDWFDDMTIAPERCGDTAITGPVRDQAALIGLINRIHDLGMELISVNPQSPLK